MHRHSDEFRYAYFRAYFEERRVLAEMNANPRKLKIAYCLFEHRRAWSINALHEATGFSRITVRKELKVLLAQGSIVRTHKGHIITEYGVRRLRIRFDEFFNQINCSIKQFHRAVSREYPDWGV